MATSQKHKSAKVFANSRAAAQMQNFFPDQQTSQRDFSALEFDTSRAEATTLRQQTSGGGLKASSTAEKKQKTGKSSDSLSNGCSVSPTKKPTPSNYSYKPDSYTKPGQKATHRTLRKLIQAK